VNTRVVRPWIAVAIAVLAPLPAFAEDNGWNLPNLNPFSSKGKPPTASRTAKSNSGWKLPRLWPSNSNARRPTNQPGALEKMTTGTKQFFSKTADALNPWDDENDDRVHKPSGSNSAFSRTTSKKKEESSSFLSPASWWSSEEKSSGRDKTVNDFLSRPRPGY
jgi:hypothetical protein